MVSWFSSTMPCYNLVESEYVGFEYNQDSGLIELVSQCFIIMKHLR